MFPSYLLAFSEDWKMKIRLITMHLTYTALYKINRLRYQKKKSLNVLLTEPTPPIKIITAHNQTEAGPCLEFKPLRECQDASENKLQEE